MKVRHFFVPVLDTAELLPFAIKPNHNLLESFKQQDEAHKKLAKFIDMLQRAFHEPIWYMGFDIIGEKFYERFIFENGGFFEVMMEAPLAMNAHFVHTKRADKFAIALQKVFTKMLPKTPIAAMFIDSIKASAAEEYEFKVQTWEKLKGLKP